MLVGMEIDVDPIPLIEANTRFFAAGPLTFGVEYRVLNDAIVDEAYADKGEMATEVDRYRGPVIDDSGVSIHVLDAERRREFLRFDCFAGEPHYHYVMPAETHQRVVPYDELANGPMFPWVMRCLRERLDSMLREAGGDDVADDLTSEELTTVLADVESFANSRVGSGGESG